MPLTVARAVEHGATVKQGDILLELDLDKIDQAIKDLRNERGAGEVALKHADEELPILEKLLPLDQVAAERAKARADEDLSRFLETDRSLAEQGARFQARSAQQGLETAKDELAQLEKMYREKDLTEETEQMILKRHKFMVEAAQFQVKFAEDALERDPQDRPATTRARRSRECRQAIAGPGAGHRRAAAGGQSEAAGARQAPIRGREERREAHQAREGPQGDDGPRPRRRHRLLWQAVRRQVGHGRGDRPEAAEGGRTPAAGSLHDDRRRASGLRPGHGRGEGPACPPPEAGREGDPVGLPGSPAPGAARVGLRHPADARHLRRPRRRRPQPGRRDGHAGHGQHGQVPLLSQGRCPGGARDGRPGRRRR